MRNVNILTIHKEPNYGAVLQAYALYRAVEDLGHCPHMINLSMDFRSRPYNIRNRAALYVYKRLKGYSRCFEIAEQFSRRHCPNQIGDFHTLEELMAYPWCKEDYYLIGSDQVWNPGITNKLSKAFCFSFLDQGYEHLYAYAASFGNIKDEEKRKVDLDMDSLARFKRIGVREAFGVDFLHRCGIESTEVVDPTLLLGEFGNLLPRPIHDSGSLLFLSLSDTAAMNAFVKVVADKKGLPINKHFGYLQPSRRLNMQFLPIEEWLYSIASSRLVVTDSFHAMVFSIIFHRPFFVYVSEPSKAFRITNLLNALGVQGRVVSDADAALSAPKIDYEKTDQLLKEYRSRSLSFLKSILE